MKTARMGHIAQPPFKNSWTKERPNRNSATDLRPDDFCTVSVSAGAVWSVVVVVTTAVSGAVAVVLSWA